MGPKIQNALLRSKVLIAAVTPHYLASQASARELTTFVNRGEVTAKKTFMGVLIRGHEALFQILGDVPWFDFRKVPIQKGSDKRKSAAMQREIIRLADQLSAMIDQSPAYDPLWSAATNTDADNLRLRIERASEGDWRKQILWVDDRPDNNIYERRTIEAIGATFTLAESTKEAWDILSDRRFGAIISDMGRREGSREGYVLLDLLRRQGNTTPFIIYARSNAEKHKQEATLRGAQGSTNDPQELLALVSEVLA